jgi:hypothetical protein
MIQSKLQAPCATLWRSGLLALAAGALLLHPAVADEEKKAENAATQDSLDETLRKKAPELIKYLRNKHYANVGVLKFLVKKGDAAPSDNVGELNLGVANRLEVALVLSNPDEDLGIIQQASRTVAKENNVRASHLTKDGRKAFFDSEYDLAWGPRKVSASAFVTGLVSISPDLKQTKIRFQVFDKDGNLADVLDEATMETTPRLLTEAGFSYLLKPEAHPEVFAAAKKNKGSRFMRAELVDKIEEQTAYAPEAVKTIPIPIVKEKEPNPYREGPVKLTIMYDGQPQTIGTNGIVPEPKTTDHVSFILENPDKNNTYAVVLKVNGRNTLFDESYPDLKACHKWILRPGDKQTITGFQTDEKTVREFKVLSPKESQENEVNYGDNAGTFHMATFQGNVVKEDPSVEMNKVREETELARVAIGRGTLALGDIEAGGLNALKRTLRGREKAGDGARGMIVQSDKEGKQAVEHLFFKYDYADPIHDVTLRYYMPKTK